MKKLLAFVLFALLAALTTTVFGDNDGALSIVTPAQNLRLPQAEGGVSIFDVKNIQVQAKWSIEPTTPLSIDINNGALHFIYGEEKPDVPVVFTVTVEDDFKRLNSQYENLAATAVITINFLSGVFVMGGQPRTGAYFQDVWSSSNGGANWSKLGDPDWSARSRHQAVAHKGTIYVLGGYDRTNRLNDVWSSIDGEKWTRLANNAPWSAREYHQAVVHNEKIYVTGGYNGTNDLNDVWSSADGKNWSQETKTNSPKWEARQRHRILSYNGLLYVLGGYNNDGPNYNDVWSSAHGEKWTIAGHMDWRVGTGPQPKGIFAHGAVVHKGTMYVIGGTAGSGGFGDVHTSTDGDNWNNVPVSIPYLSRYGHAVLSYNGLLYVIGGRTGSSTTYDIRSSENGQSWSVVNLQNTTWPGRTILQAVIFP